LFSFKERTNDHGTYKSNPTCTKKNDIMHIITENSFKSRILNLFHFVQISLTEQHVTVYIFAHKSAGKIYWTDDLRSGGLQPTSIFAEKITIPWWHLLSQALSHCFKILNNDSSRFNNEYRTWVQAIWRVGNLIGKTVSKKTRTYLISWYFSKYRF